MLPMSEFNDGKRLIHGVRNLSVRRAPSSSPPVSQCCFLLSARLLRRMVTVMRMVFQMRNQAMLAGVGVASVRACMPLVTWEYG